MFYRYRYLKVTTETTATFCLMMYKPPTTWILFSGGSPIEVTKENDTNTCSTPMAPGKKKEEIDAMHKQPLMVTSTRAI